MTATDPGLEYLLAVLEDRGLRVEVTPAGEPRLRGPASEVTPALKDMLAAWRSQVVEMFASPAQGGVGAASPRPAGRVWLWLYGQTYEETPLDDWLWGHPDRHPAGAWWVRLPGEPSFRPIEGRCDAPPEGYGLVEEVTS